MFKNLLGLVIAGVALGIGLGLGQRAVEAVVPKK